ncbi:hypothetical protein CEXT_284311 [Caerostris extrusa]|uniref:Uncharacterized protein n=1 Tax=Caerostris extrusa TaxID=172846 RepID=A0AAV4Q3T6_CAEEX|nr:hypothetical protein CEXT_284311 [Caerostris extrusa]
MEQVGYSQFIEEVIPNPIQDSSGPARSNIEQSESESPGNSVPRFNTRGKPNCTAFKETRTYNDAILKITAEPQKGLR